MKDFHFTTEREQAEIEQILLQRKKKKTKQQSLFMAIFIIIILYLQNETKIARFRYLRK